MIQHSPKETNPTVKPILNRLNAALIGKPEVVQMVVVCLLSRGHLLFEDLPGLGKTTIAKTLAASIAGKFTRIQCTPDLLPTDITGFHVFNQKDHRFEFHPGPVFADFLLADEINRATPRAQSALLEAMAERQVTIDNQTHPLSSSFMVIATQNPVESHGAYHLPEAQLDRFSIQLSIGYLDRSHEVEMLAGGIGTASNIEIPQAMSLDELQKIQDQVTNVEVCREVREYIVDLGNATRRHASIALGLSPRGLLTWQRVSQAWAFLHNRNYVIPEDIQAVAGPVLRLRLSGTPEETDAVVQEIIESVAVPGN